MGICKLHHWKKCKRKTVRSNMLLLNCTFTKLKEVCIGRRLRLSPEEVLASNLLTNTVSVIAKQLQMLLLTSHTSLFNVPRWHHLCSQPGKSWNPECLWQSILASFCNTSHSLFGSHPRTSEAPTLNPTKTLSITGGCYKLLIHLFCLHAFFHEEMLMFRFCFIAQRYKEAGHLLCFFHKK